MPDNFLDSYRGMQIDSSDEDSYLLVDLSRQPAGYDCCVLCETYSTCRGTIFRPGGGGCYRIINSNSVCDPAAVAVHFYGGSSLKSTISNSNCGQWALQ